MEYRFCENRNWEDFASGRVLYGGGGIPNFPVRLVNEMYRRALSFSDRKNGITLYDCCCGGGYALTVLGLLNQDSIRHIMASDIDENMLEAARRNLSLLSLSGMEQRLKELAALHEAYGKESHAQAMESALRLQALLEGEMDCCVFRADVTGTLPVGRTPDIILTDIPYGDLVDWKQDGTGQETEGTGRTEGTEKQDGLLLDRMFESLRGISDEHTVFAVSMDKKQKPDTAGLKRLERVNVGKRRFLVGKFLYG